MFCKLNCKLQKAIRAHYVIRHKHALVTKKNYKHKLCCTKTITMTPPFPTIHTNTPWQVLHSPPRICQRGVAGFPLAPVQRTYNERVRVYTITFLPPGRFLYFHLHLLINKISSKKTGKPNYSFSGNKPYKSFSLREEKTLSPRRERFILAKRIVYLREGNEEHSHRTGTNAL